MSKGKQTGHLSSLPPLWIYEVSVAHVLSVELEVGLKTKNNIHYIHET